MINQTLHKARAFLIKRRVVLLASVAAIGAGVALAGPSHSPGTFRAAPAQAAHPLPPKPGFAAPLHRVRPAGVPGRAARRAAGRHGGRGVRPRERPPGHGGCGNCHMAEQGQRLESWQGGQSRKVRRTDRAEPWGADPIAKTRDTAYRFARPYIPINVVCAIAVALIMKPATEAVAPFGTSSLATESA